MFGADVARQRRFYRRRGMGGGKDTTAPTLTLPLDLPLSDTTGYLGVTTDEAGGTLYYVVTTSATPPSAAQVKSGQDDGGAAAIFAGDQAVSSTGAKTATATGLSSNTAYYAYFMHEDAAANQSSVASGGGFTTLTTGTSDASFDTLIAAMDVAPATLRQGYIAQCIQALYAAGVWAKLDLLYVLAAHDEEAGRLNWITPASFQLTAVNSPTFTTDRGFAGNGSTSLLRTGWDPATNGVNYTQNSAHLGTYARDLGNTNPDFGTETANSDRLQNYTGANGQAIVNGGTLISSGAGGSMPQHMVANRPDSANVEVYRDGAASNSGASTSAARSSVDFAIGRVNTLYATRQIAAAHVGASLSSTEHGDLYAALHTYMVALGADT